MNKLFFFMASLIMVFSLFGFNQQRSYATSYEDDSVIQETMLDNPDSIIQGKASFYGSEFNGRKTANGEIYDETALTAAHRTLPFGTVLRVTNLRNGLSVIVRINDRGPFHPDRVIDLSKNAAEEIDLITYGVTDIEAEILEQ
jgi:rare lipoprotein A (peptidoglycan hydrolase)